MTSAIFRFCKVHLWYLHWFYRGEISLPPGETPLIFGHFMDVKKICRLWLVPRRMGFPRWRRFSGFYWPMVQFFSASFRIGTRGTRGPNWRNSMAGSQWGVIPHHLQVRPGCFPPSTCYKWLRFTGVIHNSYKWSYGSLLITVLRCFFKTNHQFSAKVFFWRNVVLWQR